MQQPNQMPQPAPAAPIPMEQMRHEFERLHTGPGAGPQQVHLPQSNGAAHWASEFHPGQNGALHSPETKSGGFDPVEFERYGQMRSGGIIGQAPASTINGSAAANGLQRPMGMGYGGMPLGGMGMGMGMSPMMQRPFTSMHAPQQSQEDLQSKGKGRMVELDDHDWEAQFAELDKDSTQHQNTDAMDEEANRAMEEQLEQLDRSVHHTTSSDSILEQEREDLLRRLPDFEEVWSDALKSSAQNLTESSSYREMADQAPDWNEHTGDFNDWDNFDSINHPLNTHLRDPETGDYMFEQDNIFNEVPNPFEEGIRIMDSGGNLSLAALAFEAAVQKDPSHTEAWTRLGASQAQNEKETPAMRALEQALKLDPTNLDAMMGLAVSYTNEGYDSTAYRTLQRWVSTKYPQLAPSPGEQLGLDSQDIGFTDRALLHERVTGLFIRAAQLSPDPTTMDPDVQVGLGVLFYGSEAYDKAVDCFGAALASSEVGTSNTTKANQRPLLWNRLGATLANSGRSEEAIEAYEKALQLNPNFVRARYNLGVSCINIGCHAEAAQHLLGALDMHKMVEREGREKAREIVEGGGGNDIDVDRMISHNESTNLYDTLRRVFSNMDRRDLADMVGPGMDPATFRSEFEF